MQSFWDHRIASHGSLKARVTRIKLFFFEIKINWEKVFAFISWIVSGASYLTAYTYAVLHRLHHLHADTPKDPHSPSHYAHMKGFWGQMLGFLLMMQRTAIIYGKIRKDTYDFVEDREVIFKDYIPRWEKFDNFAGHWITRILWGLVYAYVYYSTGAPLWVWIPLCIGSLVMNPLHGGLVNWLSHKYGDRPYDLGKVTATNLLGRFIYDIVLLGEFLHNNHHRNQYRINFAHRKGEIDIVYQAMIRPLLYLKVLELIRPQPAAG